MVSWPSTLPAYVSQSSFAETIQDPVIRTDMDAGPMKMRLRFTAVPEKYSISMELTKEERAIFIAFYKDDLNYGVDEFIWYHPVDVDEFGARVACYCRFTSVYQFAPNDHEFTMSIDMEVLP
jgi:hypothetical protein